EDTLTLTALGAQAGLSPHHLQRIFKRLTAISPRQYADACRLGRLKSRLKERRTVTMALYEAGYGSSSRLYERASAQLGMTPATYQRGGRAMTIRVTLVHCPLGRPLWPGTGAGVCPFSLGADAAFREQTRAGDSPPAGVRRADAELNRGADELVRHRSGQQPPLALPLDVQATAF